MPFITYSIIFLIITICWVIYWTRYDIKHFVRNGIEWANNTISGLGIAAFCMIPIMFLGFASTEICAHLCPDVIDSVGAKTYQIEAYSDDKGPFIGKVNGENVTYEFVTEFHNKIESWNSSEVSGPIIVTEIAADQKPIMVVSEREYVGWIKWFALLSPEDKYEIFVTPEINNYRIYN